MRPGRSPSPHGRSPDRPTKAWSSGYGHSPSRYSRSHNFSPERFPHVKHHHEDFTHRESDGYRQPYKDTRYSAHAWDPHEERRWRQPSPRRHRYDSRHRSPSPKHVSFQEYEDKGRRSPTNAEYKDRGRFEQGNGQ